MSRPNQAVRPSAEDDLERNLIPGALRLVVERPAHAPFENQEPPL